MPMAGATMKKITDSFQLIQAINASSPMTDRESRTSISNESLAAAATWFTLKVILEISVPVGLSS